MALTDAGRELTEQHRLAQLAVGAESAITSEALWTILDPYDLDGSRARWLSATLRSAEAAFTQSANAAEWYVSSYQAVEIPGSDEIVVRPRFSAPKVAADLDLAGPQYVKSLIREGHSPAVAHELAYSRMMGVARKHGMDGGRGLIRATTAQDRRAIGYRRVTGPDPCTFCAMLASRGASFGPQRVHMLYADEQSALLSERDGQRYHLHCNCTAEIVYGDWEPSAEEQEYVDAYERAVSELDEQKLPRTQENVLSLMRADDHAGFRDGNARRRKSPDSDE